MTNRIDDWTLELFKIVFALYLLVTAIVLINLLIAMMSDTYQRIQVVSHPMNRFSRTIFQNPDRLERFRH